MTTSGTTAFTLDLIELVEEAFERCGAELRSGYDLKTARRSLNLLFQDWANRGINLWTIDSGTINLIPGTATYALPADTVDLIDHVIRTGAGNVSTQADLTCARISSSTYATLPNKLTQALPIQIWIQRLNTPQVTFWPVPDSSTPYQLVYWRLRRIQDAGAGVNTPDVPFRFIPPLVSGLSYYLSLKLKGAMERMTVLKAQYDQDWMLAADEDREKATLRLVQDKCMCRALWETVLLQPKTPLRSVTAALSSGRSPSSSARLSSKG